MAGPNSYQRLEDLPQKLAIFPLPGALLLPRGQLQLNIFEPRYLAMIDTALASDRMVGMIQPQDSDSRALKPALSAVGCAGRLTGLRESEDGRYLITLTGICRFRVAEELDTLAPFRQVRPDFLPFIADLRPPADEDMVFPRERLMTALKIYLTQRDMQADWDSMTGAPAESLVHALAMLCPFEPAEKQALLEAPGWPQRVDTLIALLEMNGQEAPGGTTVN